MGTLLFIWFCFGEKMWITFSSQDFFWLEKIFLGAGKVKILEKIDWTKCKNTLPANESYPTRFKKAIFRYRRLSMCFIVLFTALRSPNIQYGGWPNSFLASILAFSSSIESLKMANNPLWNQLPVRDTAICCGHFSSRWIWRSAWTVGMRPGRQLFGPRRSSRACNSRPRYYE